MEHDENGRKHVGLYLGVVVSNADPEKLGRVTLRVPGLIEESDWALPLGGGGAKARGVFFPPDEGADVGVWFVQGDVDHPCYVSGHWGRGETPGPAGREDMSAEDVPKVKVIETARFEIVFDDREGHRALRITDKHTDDMVEFDGERYGITIKATSALLLRADGAIDIQGAIVRINGRMVTPSGTPID